MFYSYTYPQIIQSLWLSKGKMLSSFAIGHPRQRRVPLLVLHILHTLINYWTPAYTPLQNFKYLTKHYTACAKIEL